MIDAGQAPPPVCRFTGLKAWPAPAIARHRRENHCAPPAYQNRCLAAVSPTALAAFCRPRAHGERCDPPRRRNSTTKPNGTYSTASRPAPSLPAHRPAPRLTQPASISSSPALDSSFREMSCQHPMPGACHVHRIEAIQHALDGGQRVYLEIGFGRTSIPAYYRRQEDRRRPAFELSARARGSPTRRRAPPAARETSDAFFANETAFLKQRGIDVALIDGLHGYGRRAQHQRRPALPAGRRRHFLRDRNPTRLVPVPRVVRRLSSPTAGGFLPAPTPRRSGASPAPRSRRVRGRDQGHPVDGGGCSPDDCRHRRGASSGGRRQQSASTVGERAVGQRPDHRCQQPGVFEASDEPRQSRPGCCPR